MTVSLAILALLVAGATAGILPDAKNSANTAPSLTNVGSGASIPRILSAAPSFIVNAVPVSKIVSNLPFSSIASDMPIDAKLGVRTPLGYINQNIGDTAVGQLDTGAKIDQLGDARLVGSIVSEDSLLGGKIGGQLVEQIAGGTGGAVGTSAGTLLQMFVAGHGGEIAGGKVDALAGTAAGSLAKIGTGGFLLDQIAGGVGADAASAAGKLDLNGHIGKITGGIQGVASDALAELSVGGKVGQVVGEFSGSADEASDALGQFDTNGHVLNIGGQVGGVLGDAAEGLVGQLKGDGYTSDLVTGGGSVVGGVDPANPLKAISQLFASFDFSTILGPLSARFGNLDPSMIKTLSDILEQANSALTAGSLGDLDNSQVL